MSDGPTGSGSEERSSDDSSSDNEAGATEASATAEKEDEGLNGCFDIFLGICVLWAILAQACEG